MRSAGITKCLQGKVIVKTGKERSNNAEQVSKEIRKNSGHEALHCSLQEAPVLQEGRTPPFPSEAQTFIVSLKGRKRLFSLKTVVWAKRPKYKKLG